MIRSCRDRLVRGSQGGPLVCPRSGQSTDTKAYAQRTPVAFELENFALIRCGIRRTAPLLAVGGPLRYDYDAARKVWVYARDGHCLHDRLQDELTGMGGGTLDLGTLNE
jgi:hypothetical protein